MDNTTQQHDIMRIQHTQHQVMHVVIHMGMHAVMHMGMHAVMPLLLQRKAENIQSLWMIAQYNITWSQSSVTGMR